MTKRRAKLEVSDLVVAGGKPAFDTPRHVGRPNLGDRERLLERINGVLERCWLSNSGPLVQQFGRELEELVSVKHVIPIVNGTVALEVAIRALGMTGEVIVPSFTFVATAHALQWQEITPVFCDIDPNTHNIDPSQIERHITPRTTGIVGVHLWGRPCATDVIDSIARKHNLRVLYDAAHALNVAIGGRGIGTFGHAEVFSFHATKFINSLEGGAIATNDDLLAEKIRLMINFGFNGYDNVEHVGTNGKMNEFSAAMGLTVLESLDEIVALNRENHELYARNLSGIGGVHVVDYSAVESPNYQYVVLEIEEDRCGISRDEVVRALHRENILARRYFFPGCHRMEPYRTLFPRAYEALPRTEWLAGRIMSLPTGTGVSKDDIEMICEVVKVVVSNGADVRSLLEKSAA